METQQMIAKWVKEARTDAGLSGAALGAQLALELGTERGHTKANISHWENERHNPNLQQLLAISRITKKSLPPEIVDSLSELPTGAMKVVPADRDDREFIQIPMVKLRLSAGITGFQTEPERRDGGTLGMRRSWIERHDYNPSKLIAIYVKGDSMEPNLHDGDVVVINTADTKPVNGIAFAVNFNGQAVVKRLTRVAGHWWLHSDNDDQKTYKPERCGGAECIIIGKVVRKESDHV